MNIIKSFKIFAVSAIALSAFVACEDNDSIGSSLIGTENSVVVDTDFKLNGVTVPIDSVQSRTTMQLLGMIEANGYGDFRSDFVTQYLPSAELDSLIKTSANIDSIKMLLLVGDGSFVGDSIVPMGLEVYRLNKQLSAPIYSSFNPADYYDKNQCIGRKVYSLNDVEYSDSIKGLTYKSIYVDLPRSLAVELYDLYKSDPSSYLNPTVFGNKFKGFYVRNSYGSGRVTKIGANTLLLYYHYSAKTSEGNDTIINKVGNYYAVTPEIITNNNINYSISPDLLNRAASGEHLLVAPAGFEVEVQFPLLDIINQYNANSGRLSIINNLTLEIPASKINNDYGINPPQNVMLILKNKKKQFFEKSQIPDNEVAFTASYDVSTGSYKFSSMRQYLLNAIAKGGNLTEDDYTFVITPVTINTIDNSNYYSSSITSVVSSVVPYIEQPAMATLHLENAKISLTFTNQNIKN